MCQQKGSSEAESSELKMGALDHSSWEQEEEGAAAGAVKSANHCSSERNGCSLPTFAWLCCGCSSSSGRKGWPGKHRTVHSERSKLEPSSKDDRGAPTNPGSPTSTAYLTSGRPENVVQLDDSLRKLCSGRMFEADSSLIVFEEKKSCIGLKRNGESVGSRLFSTNCPVKEFSGETVLHWEIICCGCVDVEESAII